MNLFEELSALNNEILNFDPLTPFEYNSNISGNKMVVEGYLSLNNLSLISIINKGIVELNVSKKDSRLIRARTIANAILPKDIKAKIDAAKQKIKAFDAAHIETVNQYFECDEMEKLNRALRFQFDYNFVLSIALGKDLGISTLFANSPHVFVESKEVAYQIIKENIQEVVLFWTKYFKVYEIDTLKYKSKKGNDCTLEVIDMSYYGNGEVFIKGKDINGKATNLLISLDRLIEKLQKNHSDVLSVEAIERAYNEKTLLEQRLINRCKSAFDSFQKKIELLS